MERVQEFWQEVERLKEHINQLRYRGEDPQVEIAPEDSALAVTVKVIAAERLSAPIRYNGASINPVEDLASEGIQRAMVALQFWNFFAARLFLDEAARYTRDPKTYQRIALLRLLAEFVATVVRTQPGHRPKELAKQASGLKRAISGLDLLQVAERDHYAGEVDRLRALWRQAARDPYYHALWCLVRARRSMDEEEPLLGLAWLIRAYTLLTHPDHPLLKPSPYLSKLVERAKTNLAEATGQAPEGEDSKEEVHPAELFGALVALMANQLNRQPEREMGLFALRFYQATGED